MVADSNSEIAWHRAQIRKHRETLKHLETARFTVGEISGSKPIDQTQKAVAQLKRKIRDSEKIVAAFERQGRRPVTTDFQNSRQLERPRLFQHVRVCVLSSLHEAKDVLCAGNIGP